MTQKGLILSNDEFNSIGKIDHKESYENFTKKQSQFLVEQDLITDGLTRMKNYLFKNKEQEQQKDKPLTKIIQAGDFNFKVDSKSNPQYFTEELETKRLEEQGKTFQRNKIK